MKRPWLDRFRLAAAVLVVCNHTSPLLGVWDGGNFFLTRVLARVAVPFFLMVSGCFLERGGWRTGRLLRRTLAVYLVAVAIYLPVNWYNGGYTPAQWVRCLLVDGTLYHLWYFPAVLLGVPVARALRRLGWPAALAAAGVLYAIGLGGDSWYGLAVRWPPAAALYRAVFSVCSYTRNGLFLAPLFLLLGGACPRLRGRTAAVGLAASLAAMTAEAFALRALGWPRHDSMYALLPAVMVFLFALLQSANAGRDRRAQRLALLVYVLHPGCIVLVRGFAGLVGLDGLLADCNPVHFAAVLAVSFAAAAVLDALRPAPTGGRARAWKELDAAALARNAAAVRAALAPGCRLMAVLKADAYGHGAAACARILRRAGVRHFAVACAAEGVALRRRGVPGTILVLGYTPPAQAPLLARWRLTQTVADEAHALALSAAGTPLRVHLAVDTGMHRLGIPAGDTAALERVCRLPYLRVQGMFTHLPLAEETDAASAAATADELARFYAAAAALEAAGCRVGCLHVQSSAAVRNLPPQPCGLARVGLALYGSGGGGRLPELEPVLAVRARVASVRPVAAGDGAGYGLAFRAARDSRLAVVTIGYADGLPRSLAEHGGRVLIRGRFCPVASVCMDQLLVDVTDGPDAAPGDVCTLLGRDGDGELRAEELAARCGTIPNELLSRLGPRLETARRP